MARAEILEEMLDDDQENDKVEDQDNASDVAKETEEDLPETSEQEEDVPEKYRGKTLKEIAQMHQEAERLLGKQGSELGSYRQMFDAEVKKQLEQKEKKEEEEDVDFFTAPEKAISRAIDKHPKIKQAEEAATRYQQESAQARLQEKHPDMRDIIQNPKFVDWVQQSKIRTKLLIEADQNYDFDSADELFSLWKERQSVVDKTAEVEKASRKQAVKSANTGNARGSGEQSRKIYRRSDIRNLMANDPERYEQLADEILKAYREGRVK